MRGGKICGHVPVNSERVEGTSIARVLGEDGERTVGWVILWDNAELSVLWIDEDMPA